jgi:penicillin-binding protein 1C
MTKKALSCLRRCKRWLPAIVATFIAVLCCAWAGLHLVPLPKALFLPPPESLELLDRNGRPLRTLPATERGYARPVTEADIPAALRNATVSAEDKRFWQHTGVDLKATFRAAFSLVRHGRFTSGGSTISQQLIKICEPRPRTFRTKFIETVQALRLEQIWDKQRILSEYLNRLDYGNRQVGCANASQFYFGKNVWDLGVSEAALLAGLPQSPSRLNPLRHFDRARKRQRWVLHRMHANEYLSAPTLAELTNAPLRIAQSERSFNAPHFCELALNIRSARAEELNTTLDLALNREARRILHRHVTSLRRYNVLNGSVVVIHNPTGEVLALVGSQDYFSAEGGQINGAWTPRSPGSALKPFLYQLAFESGMTPATVLADVPTEFPTTSGIYRPLNYDRRHHGPVRARLALANSLNIPAVKVLQQIGGPTIFKSHLNALGLATINLAPDHYGLGMAIGNPEVRLLELANAYACLARLGEYLPYRLFPTVAAGQPSVSLMDSTAAYLVADVLNDNEARTEAFGLRSPLNFSYPVACKTGTSSDFRDNWAFGYTPEFTVGVWVGNFNGSAMQNISGVTGAGPVLREVMNHLHHSRGTSWYERPENITRRTVHSVVGKLTAPGFVDSAFEVPELFDQRHLPTLLRRDDFDSLGRVKLSGDYRTWIGSPENNLGRLVTLGPLPELAWRILSPVPGSVFYLDADLPADSRFVPLRTTADSMVHWQSPSLDFHSDNGQIMVELSPGTHQITALDPETGARLSTQITVKRL